MTLPDTTVYVGARFTNSPHVYVCGDKSSSTAPQRMFNSFTGGAPWHDLAAQFPSDPPRALGIRVDPRSAGCTQGPKTLCLNGGRFRVEATYQAGALTGQADVVKLTDETGYFWFFNSNNVEVVLKVLNACTLNGSYWVYAAGLTDVNVVVTIVDTKTGSTRVYTNPQGLAYQPIQDVSAFSTPGTCP